MDIPSFKDILQKFSVFKNTSLLIPVVIGLIAVLLFAPTILIGRGLKKKVETESITEGLNRIKNLRGKAVSEDLLKIKEGQLQIHANDANEIKRLAVQTTQREFLIDDIFDVNDPNSLSPLIFRQFGDKYIGGIDQLIANAGIAGAKNAGDCPTQAVLDKAVEESGADSRSRMGLMGPGRNPYDTGRMTTPSTTRRATSGFERGSYDMYGMGGGMGMEMGMGMMSEFERAVIDQACKKRAEEISFYITPTEVSGYTFWGQYDINVQKTEAVEDCWYYQLAYWVIEDVFDTITTMNSEYQNVLDAPVKRVLHVNFSMGMNRGGMGFSRRSRAGRSDTENDDQPKYVLSSDKESILTEPCTGRYSDGNDKIDVIHFNLVCVVSTRDFMPFIQELCSAKEHTYIDESGQEHTYKHNQITILETKLNSVDKVNMDHLNYSYGDGGVVELDLICEYIFNKDGYEHLKPETVKTTLLGEEDA